MAESNTLKTLTSTVNALRGRFTRATNVLNAFIETINTADPVSYAFADELSNKKAQFENAYNRVNDALESIITADPDKSDTYDRYLDDITKRYTDAGQSHLQAMARLEMVRKRS